MPFAKPLVKRLEYFSNSSRRTGVALFLAFLLSLWDYAFLTFWRVFCWGEPETGYKSKALPKLEISPIPTIAGRRNFRCMKLNGGWWLLEGAPGKSGMSLGICNA